MIDIHHLRRLQDAASKGTWLPAGKYGAVVSSVETAHSARRRRGSDAKLEDDNVAAYGGHLIVESGDTPDLVYICAMHNSLAGLLDELEESRDRIARLEANLSRCPNHSEYR